SPVLGSPSPVLGSPSPVLGSPSPVLGSPSPVLGSPSPALGSPSPSPWSSLDPAAISSQQVSGYASQNGNSVQPAIDTQHTETHPITQRWKMGLVASLSFIATLTPQQHCSLSPTALSLGPRGC